MPFALIVAMTLFAYLFACDSKDATGLRGRFAIQMRRRPALTISLTLLIPLALYCLIAYVTTQGAALISIPLSVAYTFAFVSVRADAVSCVQTAQARRRDNRRRGVVALFGVSAPVCAAGVPHGGADRHARAARRRSAVRQRGARRRSGGELLGVSGTGRVRREKAALKDYVLKLRACATIPSPDMVAPRVMGLLCDETTMQMPFGDQRILTGVGLVGGEGEDGRTFRVGELLGAQRAGRSATPRRRRSSACGSRMR